ncbi:MAG: DEAD/DEAH box helicase family protein [Burkholderiales bacterium]|nr:DEAD/DEAH box helicase family protein [Burkholderiales bacterium]
MTYESLQLECHYDTDTTDVLGEFYRPLLKGAVRYDRAVGYFSSSTFKSCASELASFIGRDGKVRIVIGCLTNDADIGALEEDLGELRSQEQSQLRHDIEEYLNKLVGDDPLAAQTFSKMVSSGVVDIKFAFRDRGIYHEKYGVFEDQLGFKVAFLGSINETSSALAGDNHESFSVYQSLSTSVYASYGQPIEDKFEELWNGRTKKTRVYSPDSDSLALMKRIATSKPPDRKVGPDPIRPSLPEAFELRPYQEEAINKWKENKCRGILAMATGTGKTLTAISAIKRFQKAVPGGLVTITVPYQNLAVQWRDALHAQGVEVILVFDTFSNWYDAVANKILGAAYSETSDMPTLVCVEDTFKGDRFQGLMVALKDAKQKNHMLVVDECHHFNGANHIKKLPDVFNFRLGLSATPYDQFDWGSDNQYLEKYFGPIVYEFGLGKAIDEGFLTKYRYHIIAIDLDEEETEQYEEYTRKIGKIVGGDGFTPQTLAKAMPVLQQRARIVGAAKNKLSELRSHLKREGRQPFTLFYCGDGSIDDGDRRLRQVEAVTELLHSLNWTSSRVTSDETLKQREALLDRLKSQAIDAVVSIRVLDEGIDVPVCQRAYLLASQTSTRQGIQRRGRVLRKSEGKEVADIFDFLVVGATSDGKAFKELADKEIKRGYHFAKDSINRSSVVKDLEALQQSVGLEIGDPEGHG